MTLEWYRTTTEENATDYLEKAADFCQRSDQQHKWKWVALSLHGALYGFAICALVGTDPDRVVTYSKKKGKLVRRLISFPVALERCQGKSYMHQYVDSKVLKLSKDEKWAIEKLTDTLRNNFTHFTPKFHSIEVSGMPQIVGHVSRVINFLAFESGNLRLLSGSLKGRIRKALAKLE